MGRGEFCLKAPPGITNTTSLDKKCSRVAFRCQLEETGGNTHTD